MRPLYHYAPRANWLSDPNGLVWHAGEWHMAYQYNPHGEEWGHMAWGHAVSHDLVTWTELAPALLERDGVMVYSGSAVVDQDDTAGFGAGAMVAIYTDADPAADRQAQSLAWSLDHGRSWTRHAGNPVLDEGLADFRDPNVFWHAGSGQWIMVVAHSTQNRLAIHGSPDLRHWTRLSWIDADAAPGHLWECPLLIALPVEGSGEERWIIKVDVLSGAPGSGALYRVGHFDGVRFVAEGPWQVIDHGQDFYAAIAWHAPRDPAGRPAWIGWMGNHAVQKHLPLQGWRGAMSVPRRLSLVPGEQGLVLRQCVELALLARFAPAADPGDQWPAATLATLAPGDGALALVDAVGRHVRVTREGARLVVERRDPVTPELNARAEVAVDSAVALSCLTDHGSIELFDATGTLALTMQHRLAGAVWAAHRDSAPPIGFSQPAAPAPADPVRSLR